MSIRDELRNEPVVNVKTVPYNGKNYILQGDASADLMNSTFLTKQDIIDKYKKHWSAVPQVGRVLEDITIRQVLLVHATLQPDMGEPPYDVIEIAQLSISNGGLFLTLYTGAQEVAGTMDQVAAGNLEAPPLGNPSSTGGASEATEVPDPSS